MTVNELNGFLCMYDGKMEIFLTVDSNADFVHPVAGNYSVSVCQPIKGIYLGRKYKGCKRKKALVLFSK